jgi:hypothetical protein
MEQYNKQLNCQIISLQRRIRELQSDKGESWANCPFKDCDRETRLFEAASQLTIARQNITNESDAAAMANGCI